jgi:branched-chain amino acid transport system permease protein
MKKLTQTARSNSVTYGIVIVAFVVLQLLSSSGHLSNSLSGQLIPICVYICMAVSLNLTVGILGELSLGHAGFMSVGAFSGILVAMSLQNVIASGAVRLLLAILGGGVAAAIAGVIVGVPVLRLRGDYLAIVTLAFGEIIKNVLNNLYAGVDSAGLHFSLKDAASLGISGGTVLINGPMGATSVTKLSTFFAGFLLVLFTLFVTLNLIQSRSGRAIMAIRDNRIAAESVGLNVTKYKLMAFVVSAALAGMAGALYAMNYSTVVPKKFDFNTSILVLVFVVLGGMGNIRGSIIAAAILTVLPELLRAVNDYRMLIYAIVLILVMLVTNNPTLKAVWTTVKEKLSFLSKKKSAIPEEGGADHE